MRLFRSLLLLFFISFAVVKSNAQRTTGRNSIVIKALNSLQYDVVRFRVKPGEKVEITFNNVSDMAHNLLIIKPGTRLKVVSDALQLAENGPLMNYIPKTTDILWYIPVISPGQIKSVTFSAPDKPGIYPYVCTIPGHGYIMYGAMYVQEENMPDIKSDIHISDSRRHEDKVTKETKSTEKKVVHTGQTKKSQKDGGQHSFTLTPPYLQHAYLDGVSPAAVAVSLPQQISYCWDNETCRLSFAWKGGFIDMSDIWKGHFNASAEVLGDIFFRDNTDFPIRLGDKASIPVTMEYRGYRLINQYPEFRYLLDGMEVYELIVEKADGNGLIRTFRIPNAQQPVWFFTNREEAGIEYESSAGKWNDKKLELSPSDAKKFTITMTSFYLAYKKK